MLFISLFETINKALVSSIITQMYAGGLLETHNNWRVSPFYCNYDIIHESKESHKIYGA